MTCQSRRRAGRCGVPFAPAGLRPPAVPIVRHLVYWSTKAGRRRDSGVGWCRVPCAVCRAPGGASGARPDRLAGRSPCRRPVGVGEAAVTAEGVGGDRAEPLDPVRVLPGRGHPVAPVRGHSVAVCEGRVDVQRPLGRPAPCPVARRPVRSRGGRRCAPSPAAVGPCRALGPGTGRLRPVVRVPWPRCGGGPPRFGRPPSRRPVRRPRRSRPGCARVRPSPALSLVAVPRSGRDPVVRARVSRDVRCGRGVVTGRGAGSSLPAAPTRCRPGR